MLVTECHLLQDRAFQIVRGFLCLWQLIKELDSDIMDIDATQT